MDQNRGEEPELTVAGSYGNYNALTLHGLASGLIGENLYGKISFSSRRRDGYLENHIGQYSSFYQGQGISDFEFNDKDPRKIDRDSFRAALYSDPKVSAQAMPESSAFFLVTALPQLITSSRIACLSSVGP